MTGKEIYVTPDAEVYSIAVEQALLVDSLNGGGTGDDLNDPGTIVLTW